MSEVRATRRHLLGYAAVGGAGLAAGAGAVTLGRESAAPDRYGAPRTISPYGAHQSGVTAPTPRANRLVALDVHADLDTAGLGRLMRAWTGTIEAVTLGRVAPGDTAPDLAQANVDLSVTVGWGRSLFPRLGLADRPPGLAGVPDFDHDRLDPRWCGGDLLLMIGADDDTTLAHVSRRLLLDAAPFATPRWVQDGSWRGLDADHRPTTGRNLFGQVDGTANLVPTDPLFGPTVWSAKPDWFVGGTTLVVRRIRMDLDRWDALTRDEQERSIGRDLARGVPLGGRDERDQPDFLAEDAGGRPVIPADAHVRLAHPSANGGARILRRGLNYSVPDPVTGSLESGLVFCSFQADIERQFTHIQRVLDRHDALNEWTTAIGSAEFAILPGFEPGGWLGEPLLG